MTHVWRFTGCWLLFSLSGCAIHTPFEVCRYWADYNTERQWNAQCEVHHHLPPKTARVKMMRWGYNVGPDCPSATGTLGIGTGVWTERLMFWRRSEAVDANGLMIDGAVPPTPPSYYNMPPDTQPIVPPLAPPAEPADPLSGNLSTVLGTRGITTVGHNSAGEPPSASGQTASAAWIFAAPARTPRR